MYIRRGHATHMPFGHLVLTDEGSMPMLDVSLQIFFQPHVRMHCGIRGLALPGRGLHDQ